MSCPGQESASPCAAPRQPRPARALTGRPLVRQVLTRVAAQAGGSRGGWGPLPARGETHRAPGVVHPALLQLFYS